MSSWRRFPARVLVAVALACLATTSNAASFQGLGFLDASDPESFVSGVSGDGSTVVGVSPLVVTVGTELFYTYQGFRWSAATGMVALGIIDGPPDVTGTWGSGARGVSGDGSVIVGEATRYPTFRQAYRWTASTGLVGLGVPGDPAETYSIARGVSGDGSVVIGEMSGEIREQAFRWTASEGLVPLGFLDPAAAAPFSLAFGISADGTVIVGASLNSSSNAEAFRWSAADGMEPHGILDPEPFAFSLAFGVSADGSVVVGALGSDYSEAFRWTESTGMLRLGLGPLGAGSAANATSADGSIVVGSSDGDEALIWDEVGGMRSLRDVLAIDFGLDLAGWQLTNAVDISDDGRTIVGNGTGPQGFQAWIAQIPEPSSAGLAAVGVIGLALLRRARRAS